jgi:hypothetical protein
LDLLLAAGRHARNQTILQFFLEVVESSGPTHEQQLRKNSLHQIRSKVVLHSDTVFLVFNLRTDRK